MLKVAYIKPPSTLSELFSLNESKLREVVGRTRISAICKSYLLLIFRLVVSESLEKGWRKIPPTLPPNL